MKILIAEDIEELRELIVMMVQGHFQCEIYEAANGAEGIEVLKTQQIDMVISDYNMPKKNGGELFKYLRTLSKSTPYIMLSSDLPVQHPEFDGDAHFGYIEKPFTDAAIQMQVQKLVDDGLSKQEGNSYIPISISNLINIKSIHASVYLKLSDSKYIKILTSGAVFTEEEYKKYNEKNVKFLYVLKSEFENFLLEYKKNVLARTILAQHKPSDKIEYLAGDVSVVNQASQVFGWNDEVVTMANHNIEKVFYLMKASGDFRNSLKAMTEKNQSFLGLHTILLSMAISGMAPHLKLSDQDLLKLTSAAILHDMDLSEDFFADKINMLSMKGDLSLQSTPEMLLLHEHPKVSAALIRKADFIPGGVDLIVEKHHEKPDGSGFPLGLKASQIDLLSSIFILVEDVIYNYILEQGRIDPIDYLKNKKDFYSVAPFDGPYQALLQSLQ